MDFIDKTRPIREGENFETAKVEAFLKAVMPELGGTLTVEQFPGGHSNLTYLLKIGDRELVLRRPPFGRKAKTAHDMGREYRIQKALKPLFPYCPDPLIYTEDESIIGCPFYVMERIKGIILRKDLPKGLSFSPQEARALCEKFIDVYAALHHVDYKKVGLESYGKPESYIRRQVQGWSERYRDARTDDAPDFEPVMAWLHAKMPGGSLKSFVIHNDYRFDNVVLDPLNPLKIIGVLDWEMSTIGDPLMDLGAALAYWVQRDDPPNMQAIRISPTHLKGMMTRGEFVNAYAERMDLSINNIDFYYCFGLFRLAVIAQQIYYRFYHGQTNDERFKLLIFAVHVLEGAANDVIKRSDL